VLTAGAACLDITPPLGVKLRGFFNERRATTVHDPLQVRAFVVDCGLDAQDEGTGQGKGEAIAVAVCDLVGVPRVYLDRAKALIAERTPLTPERVMIACTHTHTGPETDDADYGGWLAGRVADAVAVAWEGRQPAEVGWGAGSEPRVAFNRRYRMKDGTVRTNPGIGNPDVVEPVGPIDPEVGVLCLRRPGGGTIGLLASYALHYVGTPDAQVAISADYFGLFAEKLALSATAEHGLPTVIVNPTLVIGPNGGPASTNAILTPFLGRRLPALPRGGASIVDVRDVAAALPAAALRGRVGQRYLLTAANWSFRELTGRLAKLTGRPAPRLPSVPAPLTQDIARLLRLLPDAAQRVPFDAWALEMWAHFWYADASKARAELGFAPRDPSETLAAAGRDLLVSDPGR
jgi:hypothetical protein